MLEKLKRKKVSKQEKQMPQNIEQLIQMYGLNDLWEYIDQIVDYINKRGE